MDEEGETPTVFHLEVVSRGKALDILPVTFIAGHLKAVVKWLVRIASLSSFL